MKKFKKGTLVTGRVLMEGGGRLPLRTSCEEHVFKLTSDVKPDKSRGSGFVQAARCVVDGWETGYMDLSWWQEKAKEKHLKIALRQVEEDLERLTEARKFLKKKLA